MITTRTEDKNKNNFKIITENFQKWILNEEEDNRPVGKEYRKNGERATADNTPDVIWSKKGSDFVLKADEANIYAEIRYFAEAAIKIALDRKEKWKKHMKDKQKSTLEAYLEKNPDTKRIHGAKWMNWLETDFNKASDLFIDECIATQEFFREALRRCWYPDNKGHAGVLKQLVIKMPQELRSVIRSTSIWMAGKKDNQYDQLDQFDDQAFSKYVGTFSIPRRKVLPVAEYYGRLWAETIFKLALGERIKARGGLGGGKKPVAASQNVSAAAMAGPVASSLVGPADFLNMSVSDLESTLATPEGQQQIITQLQQQNAPGQDIDAVTDYITQQNQDSPSSTVAPGGDGGMSSPDAPMSVPAGAGTAQASAASPAAATVQTSAGAPSWIKRKAARQEELLRRLNQGLTPVQEQVRPDPTKFDAKISAGELKLDTDKLSGTAPGAAPAAAKPETQSITLKKIQQALIRLGYNLGPRKADGVYGRATYTAIRNFQKKNKLKADGLVGPNTFARIREKDKVLKGQSDKIGTNLPKSAEKTLDKVAKAPRGGGKLMAYATAAMSEEGKKHLEKVKASLRKKRKEAIKDNNQEAVSKINAAIRSIGAGESKAREIKSVKKQRDFAVEGNALHMLETEWTENTKIFFSWEPELRNLFKKEFSKNKGGIKFGALGRALQIYRTGKNSENKPTPALQKKMKRVVKLFQDELKKLSKEK